jgi:hypothetical protein
MKESTRLTLLEKKVIDVEVKDNTITFYLEDKNGACYALEIEGKYTAVRFLD